MVKKTEKLKVLYFVTEDSFFCSHRLPLALAAQEKGAEVVVVTRVAQHGDEIKKAGFKLIPLQSLSRSKLNFWSEFVVLKELYSILLKEKPSILHNIAMKPVLYGSLLSRFTGIPKVVNTLTGLGYIFTHNDRSTLIKRKIFTNILRQVCRSNKISIVLQNRDDYNFFRDLNLIDSKKLILIRGSGVDLKSYDATPEPDSSGEISVAFVSRMLKDKGILELIDAIRLLKERKVEAKFIFCGDIDPENPTSVTKDDLVKWNEEGLITWKGFCNNISEVYKNAHLAVLPSYREGLPKSLLEAASSGRAIVSTDVPGCREIVEHDVNGLLVPVKNPVKLAEALETLIKDSKLRKRMGQAGRTFVEENFSSDIVIDKTLKVYGI